MISISFRVEVDWVGGAVWPPHHVAQKKNLYFTRGESTEVVHEWSAECEERDTEITSSEWFATDGGALNAATLVGTKASVIYSPRGWRGRLTNKVTLKNGEILTAWHWVEIES